MSAVFFASNSDPSYTVTVDTYPPGGWGPSGSGSTLNGKTVHIADGSIPNLGGDAHLTILNEQAETDCEFWTTENNLAHINALSGGGTLTVGNGGCGPLATPEDGTSGPFVAYAGGLEMVRFLVRPEELLAGSIPHALYMSFSNNKSGHIWPATSDDGVCTGNANDAQQGDVYYLDSAGAATLAASSAPPWKKTFLAVFHNYGVFDLDSSGCNSPSANYSNFLGWDPMIYTQFGTTTNTPWDQVLSTIASDGDASDLASSGDYKVATLDLTGTGLSQSNFHVLSAYAAQCVVQGVGCPTTFGNGTFGSSTFSSPSP